MIEVQAVVQTDGVTYQFGCRWVFISGLPFEDQESRWPVVAGMIAFDHLPDEVILVVMPSGQRIPVGMVAAPDTV